MKKLPDSIIEAAFHRQEKFDVLVLHPAHKRIMAKTKKAYAIMNRFPIEEMHEVEGAWAGEMTALFEVGYALGLADGVETGKAIGEAESAATR